MPRIYFLQVWFNLWDPGVEDALYDSAAMRAFVNIDLGCCVPLELLDEVAFESLSLLASNLGKKKSKKLGAIQTTLLGSR